MRVRAVEVFSDRQLMLKFYSRGDVSVAFQTGTNVGYPSGSLVARYANCSIETVAQKHDTTDTRLYPDRADRGHYHPAHPHRMAIPTARVTIKREKERELRHAIWEMREN